MNNSIYFANTPQNQASIEQAISSKKLELKLWRLIDNKYQGAANGEMKVNVMPNRRQYSEIHRHFKCRACGKGYELIQHLNAHKKLKLHGLPMTRKQYMLESSMRKCRLQDNK